MKRRTTLSHFSKAFSMLEMLITVGVLGLVVTMGLTMVKRGHSTTVDLKLKNDVASLNRAVKSYLAEGGNLTGTSTVAQVLARLKTSSTDSRMLGYDGGFIDSRLEAVMQTSQEAASEAARVFWSTTDKQFRIAFSGLAGAKQFRFNDTAPAAATDDERRVAMKTASEEKWLWDYQDSSLATSTPVIPNGNNEVPESSPPPNPTTAGSLLPPNFSISGGEYDYFQFPLSLELGNPNPADSSIISYSINQGPWTDYNGPISVPRDAVIASYCRPVDSQFVESGIRSSLYSANSPLISGGSTGSFTNALGGPNMVYNTNADASKFEFGQAATGFSSGSTLEFAGAAFENIKPDEVFQLGMLTYYNSTTWIGTSAYQVTLKVDLALSEPNISSSFEFKLDLESTPNLSHLSEDEKADFVRFDNIYSDFSAVFGGETYYLNLQFGNAGANGFTSVDQFHVHENHSTSGEIMAWFSTTQGGQGPGGSGNHHGQGNGGGPGKPQR